MSILPVVRLCRRQRRVSLGGGSDLTTDSLLFQQSGGPGSGLDRKGKSRAPPEEGQDFLALNIDDGQQSNYQQMQLVEQQDSYITSRSTAIESIESTIAELGQIFSQLANMVAEQRETVQRIDADVTDISANVSGAQRELLKYYASISSNRWLMLKIFGVLIIFVSLPFEGTADGSSLFSSLSRSVQHRHAWSSLICRDEALFPC